MPERNTRLLRSASRVQENMLFWGVVLVVTDRVHVDGIYLLDYGRVLPRRGLVLGMYPGFERLHSMRLEASSAIFLDICGCFQIFEPPVLKG